MNRRRLLHITSLTPLLTVGGCLTINREAGTRGNACQVPQDKALVSMLPPAPDGRTRRVDDDISDGFLTEYRATAAVSAEYPDSDQEVLDAITVRLFRFEEDADAERILRDLLTDIEFDSGREGVGVLDGRIGFVAAAPHRAAAESSIGTSTVVSDTCVDLNRLLPTKTRSPGEDTPRSTSTSE